MLLLILHNDPDYLEKILAKIQEKKEVKAVIQHTHGLGQELVSGRVDTFSGVKWAETEDSFDYALIVKVGDQKKIAELKELIKQKMDLYHYSGNGLIITLPYASIEMLKKRRRKTSDKSVGISSPKKQKN